MLKKIIEDRMKIEASSNDEFFGTMKSLALLQWVLEELKKEECQYILNDEDNNLWECSNCELLWGITEGTPKENEMNYCPKCGFKIESKA